MLPDRVSSPGPLTYESGALPIALRGPADEINSTSDSRHQMGNSVMCLSIGTPKNNKFSICSKWKINYC